MKIGILTYYGDLNCGTNLQAYATLLNVRNVFPNDDVEIIPFHGFTPPNVRPGLYRMTLKSLYWDIHKMKEYKRFISCSLNVTNDRIIKNVDEALSFIKGRNYDRIYIGADTLLELDRLPKGYDGLSAYWLRPEIKADKYLLAASAKNVEFAKLTENQKQQIIACISDYKAMYVRDNNTYQLISSIANDNRLKIICDPTFTLDIDYSNVEQYIIRHKLDLSNAICLYTLRGEKWETEFANNARKAGYKVYSFRNASWADHVLLGMNPFEQLGIYRYFKCFITHRFHDTVFCLMNSTPVISYPFSSAHLNENSQGKISSLLDTFQLTGLCYEPDKANISGNAMFKKACEVMQIFPELVPSIKNTILQIRNEYIQSLVSTAS